MDESKEHKDHIEALNVRIARLERSVEGNQPDAAVYFFEKPTIAFCPECNRWALWTSGRGLYCPVNKDHKLSVFLHNENSRWPEDK